MEQLERFGRASGLGVNNSKSVPLPLGTQAAQAYVDTLAGMPELKGSSTCRYLGVQVGSGGAEAANCSTMIQGIWYRLRFVIAMSHTTLQRAAIARATIVPKVLCVTRHSWPSRTTVTQLQDFVHSFVWGTYQG